MDGLLSSLLQCFRKPARDLELMKVDNWFSITVGLARYLVKNASSIRSVFWDSMCGNGIFLQTEVWDAGSRFRCFRAPGAQRDDTIMRLIDWGADESPRVSGIADLELIRNSRMMFARKFDSEIDSDIVKAIESMVG